MGSSLKFLDSTLSCVRVISSSWAIITRGFVFEVLNVADPFISFPCSARDLLPIILDPFTDFRLGSVLSQIRQPDGFDVSGIGKLLDWNDDTALFFRFPST